MKGKINKSTPLDTVSEPATMTSDSDANGIPREPPAEPGTMEQISPDLTAEEIKKMAAECVALNERYIRLLAEYDNFRKRTSKEREHVYRSASEDFMKELLPILDNLDKATEHRNSGISLEEYVNGIAKIEDQLRNVLSHAGLAPMQVVGQPFDPSLHEAIMQVETDEFPSGAVTQEVQKGYALGGHVLRHAKVVVNK